MEKEEINFETEILVVDDDEQIRSFIRVILIKLGFAHVDTCSSSEEVIRKLKLKKYGLIFLDINLPGVDGLSLLRHVQLKYSEINVIMCSGNSTAKNVKEAVAKGAVSFLAKPVLAGNIMKVFDKMGVKYVNLMGT